jgi:hypothetical protein
VLLDLDEWLGSEQDEAFSCWTFRLFSICLASAGIL